MKMRIISICVTLAMVLSTSVISGGAATSNKYFSNSACNSNVNFIKEYLLGTSETIPDAYQNTDIFDLVFAKKRLFDKDDPSVSLLEVYRNLLQNNVEFIYRDSFHNNADKYYTIAEYIETCYYSLSGIKFAVVDMDGNNIPELIVEEQKTGDKMVFRYENDKIYGYPFVYRGLKSLKTDGTFDSSGSAVCTNIEKLIFLGKTCEKEVLAQVCGYDNIYRIGNQDVSKDALMLFFEEQGKKEDVVFYTFSSETVADDLKKVFEKCNIARSPSVNDFILNDVNDIFDYFYDDAAGTTLVLDIRIARVEQYLSIIYEGVAYRENAPYPLNLKYATNLHAESMEPIKLSDVFVIDDDFVVNLVYHLYEQLKLSPFDEAGGVNYLAERYPLETLKELSLADDTSLLWSELVWHFDNGALSVNLDVPHAIGDYAEFFVPLFSEAFPLLWKEY